MSESESVANHINEFNMIVSQLSSVEINFEDEIKVLILMSSFPKSWNTLLLLSAVLGNLRKWSPMKFEM